MARLASVMAAAGLLGAIACGGSGSATSPSSYSTGAFAFTALPMDMSGVTIVPLGNLAPPDHILPTDHIYFVTSGNSAPRALFAPSDGQVQFVLGGSTGSTLGIRNGSFLYQWGPIQLDTGITQSTILHAGQRVGQTVGSQPGFDFGLMNYSRQLTFANPARYVDNELYCDSPIAWFTEPLRSQLYSVVQRINSDKDGRINFDLSGRLAGNWFAEGLAPSSSQSAIAWPQQLAFVADNYDSARLRIVVGSAMPLAGAFEPAPGGPAFADVSSASGKVAFILLRWGPPGQPPGAQLGVMIVEMQSDTRIRVETVTGSPAATPDFTSAARIYVR